MTEYKKISFRQIKNMCEYRRKWYDDCYHAGNAKTLCTTKNCPIWKRLKSIQNEDAISFLTNEMHPDKPVTEGGR